MSLSSSLGLSVSSVRVRSSFEFDYPQCLSIFLGLEFEFHLISSVK